MKRAWLLFFFLSACSKKTETGAEPSASASAAVTSAPATLRLDVAISGEKKVWEKDAFERTAKFSAGSKARDGDDRDTWSLRDLAHGLVGPHARVKTVVGGGERATIDEAAWNDPSRTPILHTTRRGTLKFRWADATGKWSDAAINDVTGLELTR